MAGAHRKHKASETTPLAFSVAVYHRNISGDAKSRAIYDGTALGVCFVLVLHLDIPLSPLPLAHG